MVVAVFTILLAGDQGDWGVSLMIQVVIILAMLWGAYTSFKISSILFFLPAFGVFVSGTIFFGIGPLRILLYPEVITPTFGLSQLLWVQMQNVVGILCIMVGLYIGLHLPQPQRVSYFRSLISRREWLKYSTIRNLMNHNQTICLVLIRTYWILYSIWFLSMLGKLVFDVDVISRLPEWLAILFRTKGLTILLGTILAFHYNRLSLWIPLSILIAVSSIDGLLTLMSGNFYSPFLTFIFGYFIYSGKIKTIVVGFLVFFTAYQFTAPYFKEGRNQVWYSMNKDAAQYWADLYKNGIPFYDEKTSDPLLRFDHSSIQFELGRLYDHGYPGGTYEHAYWVFLPRFLFPNKPPIDFAADVTHAVFGHRSSSTASTVFGEAYWNGGWLYLIFTSLAIGFFFYVASLISILLLMERNAIAMIIAFYANSLGGQLPNLFTAGFLSPLITFLALTGTYFIFARRFQ